MLRCLGWIIGILISFAGEASVPPEPFVIDQLRSYGTGPELQNKLWIAEESADRWTIDIASSPGVSARYGDYFDYIRKESNLKPNQAYWGIVRIKNALDRDIEWLLRLSHRNSYTEVYTRPPNGTFTKQQTGQYLSVSKRAVRGDVGNSVWLSIRSGQVLEVYVRVERITGFRPRFGMELIPPQYWVEEDVSASDLATGFVEGALCIAGLCFLFYYTTSRDRTYLYYALFLLTIAIYVLLDFQHFFVDVILGDFIHLKLYLWLITSSFYVFLILFVRSFLRIPQRFPRLDLIFKLMIGVRLTLLVVCLGILYDSYSLYLVDEWYATPVNFAEIGLWIPIIVYLAFQRPTRADFFMLLGVGIFALFMGFMLLTFQVPGLHTDWVPYIYNVGFSAQVICLFVALGIRQRASQEEALSLKTRMNQKLKEKVKRRTRKINQQRQQLQEQAKKMESLFNFRSRLISNISHEFRTPLTLIIDPLERLIQSENRKSSPKAVSMFGQMKFHAQSLLQFVDELLMLSRIETDTFSIHRESADITSYLRPVLFSYYGLAERHQINYRIDLPDQSIAVSADLPKITMIVNNLLSNAFKFTPKDGNIMIRIRAEQRALRLTVQDNGVGIDPQEHQRIFTLFYQSKGGQQLHVGGTGIGLSLTQEVVKLHGGSIQLESQPGKGTTFTVFLPIVQKTSPLLRELAPAPVQPQPSASEEPNPPSPPEKAPQILIVEDNLSMQQHIKEGLQDSYRLLTASNGDEGRKLAEKMLPDLVITDLAMPLQDGLQMTQNLKGNVLTDHIPIIMLTAWADQENQLSGWQHGADAFVAKPFDTTLLKAQVTNLIETRSRLREHYLRQLLANPETQSSASTDNVPPRSSSFTNPFLEKLRRVTEERYSDCNFNVVALSQEMSLSTSQLNRKLNSLIHQSASYFIRTYRLQKAEQLLRSPHLNVAEIAYEVGFSSPSYFTRRFREHFGYPPSRHQTPPSNRTNAR